MTTLNKRHKTIIAYALSCLTLLTVSFHSLGKADPNIHYVIQGQDIKPWQSSLNFGKTLFNGEQVNTVRNSLTLEPIGDAKKGKVLNLKWKPRGIKNEWGGIDANILTYNVTNTMRHTDLTSIVNDAALTIELKVNKPPKENVELMLECGWDWKCRTKFPLKNALKRLPKGKWQMLPIPLKCLATEGFDFSKVTTIFSLQTLGKLDIEIANIQLTALPAGQVNCG